jgi:hypothetical protein
VDTPAFDTAPKVLENLVAAGLVSHELIGDPAKLSTETAALAALCARVSGPVYRLGAFHYAFRAMETDLGGALAGLEPGEWAGAIEAALGAEFGEEAVWVTGADLVADAEAGLDGRQILFLKAAGGAVTAALAGAPELEAVVHAGIAARSAETAAALTAEVIAGAAAAAGADAGALARTIEGLSVRIEALEAGIGPRIVEAVAEAAPAAVTAAVSRLLPGLVSEAVAAAMPGAVAGTVPGAVSGAVSEAMADVVASEVAREVGFAVENAVGGAMQQVAAVVARTAGPGGDPGIERVVSALELVVGRLGEQAVRTAEHAARQDALASGIVAIEAAMENLAAAETAREAERDAAFAAFENRLGLTLAEFLAQVGTGAQDAAAAVVDQSAAGPARIVEMGAPGREATGGSALDFAAAARTAQLG